MAEGGRSEEELLKRLSAIYGEAVGGGEQGDEKKTWDGLVRAYFCDQGVGLDAGKWVEGNRLQRIG